MGLSWSPCFQTKLSWILFVSIFYIYDILGQVKGAYPLSNIPTTEDGVTRALVIGISDYQSPKIEDLQFADKDAFAFADWLKSPAGGNLTEDQIIILSNAKATRSEITSSLDWLLENTRKGDRTIIYFSGHGDVETKTKYNRGYVLCYDSPPNNYAAGALPINHLQDVITTLSDSGKTMVVLDACRSGKLAGNEIQGTFLTASEMMRQFNHEIKILSCQPDEYSHEGKQWGDGRGVFSYFLLDALHGLADANQDKFVSLGELNRYIPGKINYELSPLSQTPMFIGNANERLSKVNETDLLGYIQTKTPKKSKILSALESKGREEEVLAKVDIETRNLYFLFKEKLATGIFFDYNALNADSIYKTLILNQNLKPLHSYMRRNYAVALQNEVQQAINALLDDDPYEFNNWFTNPKKYSEYPHYLDKALELLGENHPSAPLLKTQKLYFEAYRINHVDIPKLTTEDSIKPLKEKVKSLLLEALDHNPDAAYIYFSLTHLYLDKANYQFDSVYKYFNLTRQFAPTWANPFVGYFDYTLNTEVNAVRADSLMVNAVKIKPNSYHIRLLLSWLRQRQGRHQESDSICMALIKDRPDLYNAWSTLAQTHAELRDWKNTLRFADSSLLISPGDLNWVHHWYYKALLETEQREKAASYLITKINVFFSDEAIFPLHLAQYYSKRGYHDSAYTICIKLLLDDRLHLHDRAFTYELIAKYYLSKKQFEKAHEYFQKAIDEDPTPDAADLTSKAYIAVLHHMQGHSTTADSLFRDCLEKYGFFWYGKEIAHQLYGDFLFQQNRLDEAITHFKKSLSYSPYYDLAYIGLSKSYLAKGKKKDALKNLKSAIDHYYFRPPRLRNDPDFEMLWKNKTFKKLTLDPVYEN